MDSNIDSKKKSNTVKSPLKKSIKKITFWLKHFEPSKLQLNISKSLYVAGLLVLVVFVSFQVGYIRGNKKGENTAKASSANNSLANLFGSQSGMHNTVTGKISSVDRDAVKIDSSNGEAILIKINGETKVTRKKEVLTVGDLKVGQKVTVFTNSDKSSPVAIRIVLSNKQ